MLRQSRSIYMCTVYPPSVVLREQQNSLWPLHAPRLCRRCHRRPCHRRREQHEIKCAAIARSINGTCVCCQSVCALAYKYRLCVCTLNDTMVAACDGNDQRPIQMEGLERSEREYGRRSFAAIAICVI